MGLGRFLLGCFVLVVCVGPLGWAAVRLRRRYAPALPVPVARLGETITTIALLVLIGELLGTATLLRTWAVIVACAAVGTAIALAVGPGEAPRSQAAPRNPVVALVALALGVGALAAGNSGLTLQTLRAGSPDFDTQWFHLPFAAAFFQTHSVTALHFVSVADLHQFFPANVELLHAMGMLAFGRDVLSVVLNLGFVALALLAAWCIGRARGAAAATALAVTVVLTLPQILYMSTGSAMDDVPALAFGLAAVALLAHAGSNRAVLFAVGLAGGLAAGCKATTLGFAVVLAVGAWLTQPRDRRLGTAGVLAGGLAAGGGFWYLRNLVAIGNPLPGSLAFLPSPHYSDPWGTLVHQLTSGTLTASSIRQALNFAFGPAWWGLVLLTLVGLALGLTRARLGWERAATVAAVANAIAFAFSPFGNLPVNARFLALTLAIGLCMLATAPAVLRRRELQIAGAAAFLVLIATQVKRYGGFAGGPPAVGALVALVGLAIVAVRARPDAMPTAVSSATARRAGALVMPVLLVALLAASYAEAHRYLGGRYTYRTASSLSGDARRVGLKHAFAWAQTIHHARIGIAGMDLQYALYGADLSNTVTPLGVRTAHGGLRLPASCREWRSAVNRAHDRYLVIAPADASHPVQPPELSMFESDPAVHLVRNTGGGVVVLAVTGPLDVPGCVAAEMAGFGH